METLDSVRLVTGAYDELLEGNLETTWVISEEEDEHSSSADDDDDAIDEEQQTGKMTGKRIRVAGGKYWDIILHVLPKGA